MGSDRRGLDPAQPGIGTNAASRRRAWIRAAAAVVVVAAIVVAGGVIWAVKRGSDEGARAPAVSGQALPGVSGRKAPQFTLVSATGAPTDYAPYTFTPGDGKRHLFVFFMGYF
ncbi:MAG: hypothetical protein HY682_03835 [Chloroflexi bacterium]|nr:hypothetical protein [Chloroflexota bacterium]